MTSNPVSSSAVGRRDSFSSAPVPGLWQMSLRGQGAARAGLKVNHNRPPPAVRGAAAGRRSSVPNAAAIMQERIQAPLRTRRSADFTSQPGKQQQQQQPGAGAAAPLNPRQRKLSVLSHGNTDNRHSDEAEVRARQQQARRKSVADKARKNSIVNNNNNNVQVKGARGRRVKEQPSVTATSESKLLPPGVKCIDDETDLFKAHWPEFIHYSRLKEKDFIFSADSILGCNQKCLESSRRMLMDWLLQLTLYFQVSQETLYHTVRLVDSTMSRHSIKTERLQLVAVTAFLIAAKLEEYYPPSIESLLEMTENSFKFADVISMERLLLSRHGFVAYGTEPMIFINRYIAAAFRTDDTVFYHACLFFVDLLILSIGFSEIPCSWKAAAAVYAAVATLTETKSTDEWWSSTLRHYSGYCESDVCPLALSMLRKAERVQRSVREAAATPSSSSDGGGGDDGKYRGIARKFNSRSRHGRLLGHEAFELTRLSATRELVAARVKVLEGKKSGGGGDDEECENDDVFA